MATTVWLGANRERLRAIAEDVIAQCDAGGLVEVNVEAWNNLDRGEPVTLQIGNDDMEDRDDLAPTTAFIEWSRE